MQQINLNLKILRQKNSNTDGKFVEYKIPVSTDASFLEMLDELNNQLEKNNQEPIAFESDCREGICGSCGIVINGSSHGPVRGITTCQLHMRHFKDGDTIYVEPFRSTSFPVVKDLIIDRSSFDRILQTGGFVSVNTGGIPDANAIPISKQISSLAFDAAACIGCGACVATCKNSSAMLFVSAKVSHLALLPQGQVEKETRVLNMVEQMEKEGFGACSNTLACEAKCPKNISVSHIARLNREFLSAKL